MCVRERESECVRERAIERERERAGEREGGGVDRALGSQNLSPESLTLSAFDVAEFFRS